MHDAQSAKVTRTPDLTGQRFGRLTVLRRAPARPDRKSAWECVCVCGNATSVMAKNLIAGRTKSCGCLHAEKQAVYWGKRRHALGIRAARPWEDDGL
jgi:hypothetical protein